MQLDDLRRNSDTWGSVDPRGAILTYPSRDQSRWDAEEFFATGQPATEFHNLRRAQVAPNITRADRRVLHVEEEPMAGPPFTSYLYVVGKDA